MKKAVVLVSVSVLVGILAGSIFWLLPPAASVPTGAVMSESPQIVQFTQDWNSLLEEWRELQSHMQEVQAFYEDLRQVQDLCERADLVEDFERVDEALDEIEAKYPSIMHPPPRPSES